LEALKKLQKLLEQRCKLLFWALIALLVALPFLGETSHGQVLLVIVNVAVLLAAVAAVGRTRASFLIAVMLVLPALVFRLLAVRSGSPGYSAMAYGFNAVFYVFILASLMQYVFRLDLMSRDKLYGAVAAYILIAIFWAQLHGLIQYFYPGAYTSAGQIQDLAITDLIYFSFTALSTAGFGDIAPALIQSRYLTVLEMVVGVMFVAILIARLTGVYPIVDRRS
jgi:Ion channel